MLILHLEHICTIICDACVTNGLSAATELPSHIPVYVFLYYLIHQLGLKLKKRFSSNGQICGLIKDKGFILFPFIFQGVGIYKEAL